MRINFENVGHCNRKLIAKIYDKAMNDTGNRALDVTITVSIVSQKRIKQLNQQYRNVDKATDVLSFPMLNIKYPQKLADFKQEISPDGWLYIGDVVICKKIAKRQAKEYGHSLRREIAFLALHGLLHVLGFDHIDADDEKVMMSTAENILSDLDIKREGE